MVDSKYFSIGTQTEFCHGSGPEGPYQNALNMGKVIDVMTHIPSFKQVP